MSQSWIISLQLSLCFCKYIQSKHLWISFSVTSHSEHFVIKVQIFSTNSYISVGTLSYTHTHTHTHTRVLSLRSNRSILHRCAWTCHFVNKIVCMVCCVYVCLKYSVVLCVCLCVCVNVCVHLCVACVYSYACVSVCL